MFSWGMEGTPAIPRAMVGYGKGRLQEGKGKTEQENAAQGSELERLSAGRGLSLRSCASVPARAQVDRPSRARVGADPTARPPRGPRTTGQAPGGAPPPGDPSAQGGEHRKACALPASCSGGPAGAPPSREGEASRPRAGQPVPGPWSPWGLTAPPFSPPCPGRTGRSGSLPYLRLVTRGGGRLSPGMQRAGALASGSPG